MAKRLPARRTPAVAKPTARQAALESGQVGRRRFCGQPATPAMVGVAGWVPLNFSCVAIVVYNKIYIS
jgi:hypothetical protein